MKHIHSILTKMRATSSKLEKIAILSMHKDDPDVKEYLRLIYEQKVNLYITKIAKDSCFIYEPIDFTRELFDELVTNLSTRKITGHAARDYVASIWYRLGTPEEKELLELLIGRDVKSNFGDGTITKVWPGLITDVPYMRCSLPKDSDLKKFNWAGGIYSQIKADGMFANVHHSNGAISISSRAGSPFPTEPFKDLAEEYIRKIPADHQTHGEFLMMFEGEVLPRQVGNGLFNKLIQEGELPEGYTPIYEIWDIIPLSEAKPKNKYKVPYKTRFKQIIDALDVSPQVYVKTIEYKLVHSIQEAYNHYQDALQRELEGTIVKDPEMIWEDTTSKRQVKLKLKVQCEVRITGFKPGKAGAKHKDTFGSIEAMSECGELVVTCHGFSDKLRKELWDDREILVNKVMTIESNGIMPPSGKKTTHSLFLPIFCEIRHDKTVADDLPKIREQFQNAIKNIAQLE